MRSVGLLSSVRHQRSVGSAAVILAGVLALAACGGGSSAASPAASDATVAGAATTTADPAATTAETTATSDAAPAGAKSAIGKRTGDCGDAKVAVNVALNAAADISDEVMDIEADPSCTELILASALSTDLADQGLIVCRRLSPIAFKNGFKTVHIRAVGQNSAADGDLVHAVDGGPCTVA